MSADRPYKDRLPEIHFYEWSITRWFSSSARTVLDAKGRGIYRELLDYCYAQGSIPADKKIMAVMCACEVSDIEEIWPVLSRHFRPKKRDKNTLENSFASAERRAYFDFVRKQRVNGRKGGKHKPNADSKLRSDGVRVGKENSDPKRKPSGVERSGVEKEKHPPTPHSRVSAGGKFVPNWPRCQSEYPGLVTDFDAQMFFSIIETPDEEVKFFAGLEAWKDSSQFKRGKVYSLKRFLSEWIYRATPPRDESEPEPYKPNYYTAPEQTPEQAAIEAEFLAELKAGKRKDGGPDAH